MMTLCYRDRSIPKDSNLVQLFYSSLKKFANMYNVYIQLILSEINMEKLKEMMKLSVKCKRFKLICNKSINHRYVRLDKFFLLLIKFTLYFLIILDL
ncbi:unnamed protein product [Schistosoma spindalis]|nr:unnamed protein product [Schistosoma spindale]